MKKPTRKQIEAAAEVMNNEGFNICLPWEGTLDDVERARYLALKDAITAALNVTEDDVGQTQVSGDGQ